MNKIKFAFKKKKKWSEQKHWHQFILLKQSQHFYPKTQNKTKSIKQASLKWMTKRSKSIWFHKQVFTATYLTCFGFIRSNVLVYWSRKIRISDYHSISTCGTSCRIVYEKSIDFLNLTANFLLLQELE